MKHHVIKNMCVQCKASVQECFNNSLRECVIRAHMTEVNALTSEELDEIEAKSQELTAL